MKKFSILLLVLLLPLASCKREGSSFVPLKNGFGVVVREIGMETGPGAKLYYKGTNVTPILVWPHIGTHGYPILYSNDVAFLLADKPDAEGRLDNTALIAVQRSGPAMDISKDVLKIAANQAQVDFKKALRVCRPLRLIEQGNGEFEVLYLANELAEPNVPDLKARITWKQVFAIMEEIRQSGKTNKVTNSEVQYLQNDYRD